MDMLSPTAILDQLEARLADALATLPLDGEDGSLLSLLLALPRPPAAAPRLDAGAFQFHFQRADRGELHAGYGEAARWETEGPARFETLADAAAGLGWLNSDPDETGFEPFAMLGFASLDGAAQADAADLPNALLWVPEVGLECRDHEAALVFSTPLPAHRDDVQERWTRTLRRLIPALFRRPEGPRPPAPVTADASIPDAAAWTRLVQATLARIDAGDMEKVVLSRRLDVAGQRAFDIPRLLGALECLFPSCQVLSLTRGGRTFCAATPERLLRLGRDGLEVDALAGTALRAAGSAEDAALRDALLNCAKNLREHRVVIDAIRAALADCCDDITAPPRPEVMQLNNAQHLWSAVSARPRADTSLFDLAARLHPTPATNGQPRAAARAWRERNEPFSRGWFTGAAGIWRRDGSGELWVLLRCALVQEARATLYAGAGIVAGSEPDAEWREIDAKLSAMLSALQYA
jgi:salicylate biosynthesis isochorismate synthase